jgi:UDP:flavonoid glycosyltransferase YjiC (YdhE family)
VLDELQRRGHEIVLRTLASEVEAMRSRGFDAAAVFPEIEALPMEDWRARTATGRQLRALRTIRARAPHDSQDLLRVLESEQPDAALVDVLASGALKAAASGNVPWACYRPFPLPPFRGALRLLGIAPALSAAPLHIYMTAEPFERHSEQQHDSLVMVGPCAWEPAGELPGGIAEVEEPLALVTISSEFQDDERLVAAALEALAGEPLHVVATMPAATALDLELPANATVLPFAPHLPILRRAACAITHGGMGATQKALSLGVPVCAVPFGRDQLEVARRVERADAGTRLPAWRLRPARLRAKVREAIACRPGAERIAQAFARAGGAPAAADAVEQRLLW